MQGWSLQRKIQVTQTRIIEWYKKYDGKVYISYSGGKDSSVLLDLARRIYPDIRAVYVDTGLEYPELRQHVKEIDNVVWLKPKMNFKEVIKKYGYPVISKQQAEYIYEYRHTKSEKLKDIRWNGNKWGLGKISEKYKYLIDADFEIGDQCCDIIKKYPCKKYEKETGMHPIIGTLAEESSQRRQNWLMYGCNAFNKTRPTSQPLSFWTEQDILEYIYKFSIKIPTVYGEIIYEDGKYKTSKLNRTGCVFCMFGVHMQDEPNNFQRLKETHPKLYDYCMRPLEEGGLNMKHVLDVLKVKYD